MDPMRRMAAAVAVLCWLALSSPAVVMVSGDFARDRDECSDQLVGLASCLTYVQDAAASAAPTRDCCSGLKTVVERSLKCLCELVKDKDDPSLQGFKINVTRALGLPAICHAPANISDCPRLLNLPPNSKDAQVFEQYAKQMEGQGIPSAATGGSGAQKSAGAATTKTRWLGAGGARAALLSFFFPLAVPFLLLLA